MLTDRRAARILAMQALCQWDVQGDESDVELEGFFAAREADPAVAAYAGLLVRAFWADKQRIDGLLSGASKHWDLSRMSPVERNIMRVAVVELSDVNVPPKAAINEAIEIAHQYGGADGPRFVNGVLDEIYRGMKEDLA